MAMARDIDVELITPPTSSRDDVVVMVNRADGTLVSSVLGGALGPSLSAADGDLVTFAYRDVTNDLQIESYRVVPAVTKIVYSVWLLQDLAPCSPLTMHHVDVQIPAVGTATFARAQSRHGGVGETTSLPATVSLDISACPALTSTGIYVELFDPATGNVVATQLIDDVPFTGTSASVVAAPTDPPRQKLSFQVDQIDPSATGFGNAYWSGDGTAGYPYFSAEMIYKMYENGAPFSWGPDILAVPHGVQFAGLLFQLPPTADICVRNTLISRAGASNSTIGWHATQLAEPLPKGAAWSLGEGSLGDSIQRVFRFAALPGNSAWSLHEDPASPPVDAVFPTFPTSLPMGLVLPADPPTPVSTSHVDDEELVGYAAVLSAQPRSLFAEHTLRERVSNVVDCAD